MMRADCSRAESDGGGRRHRVQGKDLCPMMYGDKGVTK